MTITLGDLRTFCAEIASPDSAGSTHDREAMVWINSALQRLYTDTAWDDHRKTRNITVLPSESGTTGILTQGSLAFAVAVSETIEDKYADDAWEFIIGSEADHTFKLASKTDDQNATFQAGDEWILASDTGVSWTAFKARYPLPDDARDILRVQLLSTRTKLGYLTPDEFDYKKSLNPTNLSQPCYYTLRDNAIEVYPHPGSSYEKIGLTYRKGPSLLADAALNSVTIEWPEEWRDLLLKAIQVEAAETQGENSPIPYPIAERSYIERLKGYRALNATKAEGPGAMGLRLPQLSRYPHPRSFEDQTEIPDV